jgi:RNA polymerase sigma-54 factor
MALEARLVQKLGQSLTMTPQLQQAIKLLQLGRLEYKEAIEKELLENPILEESPEDYGDNAPSQGETLILETGDNNNSNDSNDSGENNSAASDTPDWDDYADRFSDYQGASSPKGLIDHENRPALENTITRTQTLQEYLNEQFRFMDFTEEEKHVGNYIAGNLDKDGFLCVSDEEIQQECNCDISIINRVLFELRMIDPIGLTARDLKECLLIQLEYQGLEDSLAATIVRDHLDKLEKRKYEALAKELKIPLKEVLTQIQVVQGLNPYPGRVFAEDDTRYVTPDVYIQKMNGEWVITLNDEGLPRLRVSPYYLEVLQQQGKESAQAKSYLNERLKAASWLIKSIHQRQQTIFKVTESIFKFQKEFLETGIEKMKPLVLREVADDIGMHESTVSRVTTNKYVHTPQGVFELKYFFTTGIKSASGDMSSSSIKDKIKTLIAGEDNKRPLSDQDIVEILTKENIDIARRTVAKYRESMNIPASSQRKSLF